MSKKVDNGVKKFFVIFLLFIVVLNVLSILLFGHSLFYLFSKIIILNNSAELKDNIMFNSIIKYSLLSKSLIPIILVGYILILIFINKKVSSYRKYIYPFMFILFLFIIEYIYLSFFDLIYIKNNTWIGCWNQQFFVYTYIPFIHPISIFAAIVVIFLVIIGYLIDCKKEKIKYSKSMLIIIPIVILVIYYIFIFIFNNYFI